MTGHISPGAPSWKHSVGSRLGDDARQERQQRLGLGHGKGDDRALAGPSIASGELAYALELEEGDVALGDRDGEGGADDGRLPLCWADFDPSRIAFGWRGSGPRMVRSAGWMV